MSVILNETFTSVFTVEKHRLCPVLSSQKGIEPQEIEAIQKQEVQKYSGTRQKYLDKPTSSKWARKLIAEAAQT